MLFLWKWGEIFNKSFNSSKSTWNTIRTVVLQGRRIDRSRRLDVFRGRDKKAVFSEYIC